MFDNAEHLTDVLQSETGKTRAEASAEGPTSADILNYFAQNAARSWRIAIRRRTAR